MSKSFVRSIKNVASGYSSVQVSVRNATSNDASGPTTFDMEEIANYTYQTQTDFLEIMEMLDRRLNDKGKNWRHVAKSLTVLDYLVRYGSEKCVLWAKDNIYVIKTLREFVHFDEANNDQGAIIRVKAKELCSLLRDDERLRIERELAQKQGRRGKRNNNDSENGRRRNNRSRMDEAYDEDLQRALELSRQTADQESKTRHDDVEDPELAAALKLSLEEDEMRKQNKNDNLLDLDEDTYQPQQQPQYYMATGYYQVPQQQQYYQAQQYDMFGNPIQDPMATGLYQMQYLQQQQQQQLLLQQQQQQAAMQQQVPQFTGFNYGQPQQQQEPMQPLKTGSNNPFAIGNPQSVTSPLKPSLDTLAEQQTQLPQAQPQLVAQNTASRFNDTHELNTLLAQGPGVDTYGNTGATRIPHQHTKTQQFINSSGTGYKQFTGSDQKLSLNPTGNPFLGAGSGGGSNGTSYGAQQQNPALNPLYTGYGFGNAPQQAQQTQKTDGPSLIDI